VLASSCGDPTITGSYQLLVNENWPDRLLIFNGLYLQNIIYRDALPGISWYIVVMLPATIEPSYLGPDDNLYYVVISLAIISLTMCAAAALFTALNRSKRIIKLTKPLFTYIAILGGVGLSVSALLLLDVNDEVRCAARPWLFNLSATLAFAPFVIKSWVVHLLFNVNPLSKNKLIRNQTLIMYTSMFVCADVVLLAITLYGVGHGTKPKNKSELTSNGAYATIKKCGYQDNQATEIIYKFSLVAIACVLSYRVRNINGTIAGSRTLVAVVYNTAFLAGVIILISNSVSNVPTRIVSQAGGICICVILNVCILVLPTFYKLWTLGDAAAADEVLEDVIGGAGGVTGRSRSTISRAVVPSVVPAVAVTRYSLNATNMSNVN